MPTSSGPERPQHGARPDLRGKVRGSVGIQTVCDVWGCRGVRSGEGLRVSQGHGADGPEMQGPSCRSRSSPIVSVSPAPPSGGVAAACRGGPGRTRAQARCPGDTLTGREVRELMELRGVVERYAAQQLVAAERVPWRNCALFWNSSARSPAPRTPGSSSPWTTGSTHPGVGRRQRPSGPAL